MQETPTISGDVSGAVADLGVSNGALHEHKAYERRGAPST